MAPGSRTKTRGGLGLRPSLFSFLVLGVNDVLLRLGLIGARSRAGAGLAVAAAGAGGAVHGLGQLVGGLLELLGGRAERGGVGGVLVPFEDVLGVLDLGLGGDPLGLGQLLAVLVDELLRVVGQVVELVAGLDGLAAGLVLRLVLA